MNKVSEVWDPASSSILRSAGAAFNNTPPHRFGSFHPEIELRARETITAHFRIPPSGHLGWRLASRASETFDTFP